MSKKSVQNEIIEVFINRISTSSKFTKDEIEDIRNTISDTQKAEIMAERILKSIGGEAHDDT